MYRQLINKEIFHYDYDKLLENYTINAKKYYIISKEEESKGFFLYIFSKIQEVRGEKQ